jgi:pyrroloquinoline-quinone synthase
MHSLIPDLNDKINAKHLLTHPFYVAWTNGTLPVENLRHYARQYFAHVRAFPTYLSEAHSRCADLAGRQIIAANLAEEEAHSPTHPELWLDFATGIGVTRESVLNEKPGPRMLALIETYRSLARMDTPVAAAALYCYEKQIPAVATAKIAGLEKNYGISDPSALRYFAVHEEADIEHAAQWEHLISNSNVDREQALKAADQALDALWSALDEVYEQSGACVSVN